MEFDLEQRMGAELGTGERLLWTGRPAQGIRLRSGDVFMIPFSLVWGGFAFFWEWTVLNQDAPGFFALWGIPFILGGLCTRELRSLWLRNLPEVSLREGPGELGAIEFGSSPYPRAQWLRGAGLGAMAKYTPPSFDLISQPRVVYDLVRKAQQAVAQTGAPSR